MKQFNNILLIRTDRIGDVILTTPAITALRLRYPAAKIYFLTKAYTAPLLEHHEFLDDVIIYSPEDEHRGIKGHWRLAKQLRDLKIDIAFLFFPQAGLALALWLAGIKRRVGTGYRWYSFLLNHRIFQHRKYGRFHELEYNMALLGDDPDNHPHLNEVEFHFIRDENLRKIQQDALREIGLNEDYLIVHPGSGGSAPNLPPEMFARIITYLGANSSLRIILSGNASEETLIEEIANRSRTGNLFKNTGLWDLETYMAVISHARLFISNSTGPLHIARAYDVPLLAFYCPAIPCSPKRWGPYNQMESVVVPDVKPCKTCNPKKCHNGNCLEKIPWQQIKAMLEKRLAQLNT